MKCEDLQFNLSLYADNDLTADEQSVLDEHLAHCPLCRVKLSEFQTLRNDFRMMMAPAIPTDLLNSIRRSVADELNPTPAKHWINLSEEWRDWLQLKMMPYAIGTAFSLLLGIAFLFSIDSASRTTEKALDVARINTNRSTAPINPNPLYTSDTPFITTTNEELVAMRTPVSGESPSLNTNGTLLTVTKSLVQGKMKNNEVTVVADVFSNGLAQIAEVVEAPRNQQSLEQLSNALENDEGFAPFVSADMDKRSDVVRVVFKIQRVDVFEKKSRPQNPLSRKK